LNFRGIYSEDDGFFRIFPQDRYDPDEYGEKQAINENIDRNSINTTQVPLNDKHEKKLQDSLTNSGDESDNFIAAGDWNCNKETAKTIDKIVKLDPELVVGLGDYTL